MKRITSIKQISSNKYSIVIDNKKHIVYDDVLLQYHILKAGEITDEAYDSIIKSNNYYEGYNKSLKYILAKQRTEKEIREKLHKLLVSKEDIQKIIERLYEEKYLDDEKYIQSYIHDEISLKLTGYNKIYSSLIKLGFDSFLVTKYLSKVEEDIWKNKAKVIYQKFSKKAHNLSKKMFEIKLHKHFIELGYDEKYYSSLLKENNYDEQESLKKEYDKLYNKYSKKYEGEKLDYFIKQKLYQKGYNVSNLD